MTDYNPVEHRTPLDPIKLWMAYFNLLRSMCGAGMLGMPSIISQTGYIFGPILTITTGLLIIYTHFLLLSCLNEIARQLKIPYVSYRYGFRLAVLHGPPMLHWVGKHGPSIIAAYMVVSQLGICTVFVLFTTDCLRDLMDWPTSSPAVAWLLFPFIVMEVGMKNLTVVSYVAMIGNFVNLVGMGFVLEHIITEPEVFAGEVFAAKLGEMNVLYAFGSLLFNLSAVGVILSIDKALVDPTRLTSPCGVIIVGIFVPSVIAIAFGVCGYWAFGTMEENILRCLPFDEITSMVAIGLYLVTIALAYPLQCYPGIMTIVEVVKYRNYRNTPTQKTLDLIEGIGRPVWVILSFTICYFVTFQGPFVAFVGNLCTSMLSLVFPALMDISLRYPSDYGEYNIHLIKDLIIIAIGLISFVFGVFFCGYLIYIRILSKNSPNSYGFY